MRADAVPVCGRGRAAAMSAHGRTGALFVASARDWLDRT